MIGLCPKTWGGSVARRHLRCGYCGGSDHAYEACPKIIAAHLRDPAAMMRD